MKVKYRMTSSQNNNNVIYSEGKVGAYRMTWNQYNNNAIPSETIFGCIQPRDKKPTNFLLNYLNFIINKPQPSDIKLRRPITNWKHL